MLKKVRSVAGGVTFLLLCAGGALAMPASFTLDPQEEEAATVDDVVVDLDTELAAVEGETTDVTVPDEDDSDDEQEEDDGAESGDGSAKANHGKAVSTAARCDLRGRAKGRLVSSVARDKSATVESAQAACDAAIAAQGTASAKPAKPAKPEKATRPDKPAKPAKAERAPAPAKAAKPAKSTAAPEVEEAPAPAPAAPPASGGPPAGKGNSKKS